MALLWFFGLCPAAGYGQAETTTGGKAATESSGWGDHLLALKIYRVDNGKMETRVFDAGSLEENGLLSIPGYVSGIVAVARPGLTIRVDGKPMSPVRPGAGGEFSLGYYGTINPVQMINSNAPVNSSPQVTESAALTAGPGLEVYSLFPAVPADTISSKPDFRVEISSGHDASGQLHISHSGGLEPDACTSEGVCDFRFIGVKKETLNRSLQDTDARLQAISDGIAAVESAFQTDLVKAVHIITYDDIHNAVTCVNQDKIWFYISTFKDEPVKELEVIAEHETLHILVDKLNLTANSGIRKMFADLKGFNDFSIERFQIVSRGHTPSKARLHKGEEGYFFEFISERNFLNGMKGGHPEENLDEFCASFLHTLMYPDRFETNLTRALPLAGGVPMVFDGPARENIVGLYISLLKFVHGELVADTALNGTDFQTVSARFFLQHLNMLKNVNQALAANRARRQ